MKLDDHDFRLLDELQRDSSRPIHELADSVGISMASCARRVKRLEQEGIIRRYVALLDPAALGLDLDIFISVRLNTQTLKTMGEFRKIVASMPEVVECYALTGDTDFLLHVRTAGVKEFNRWMQDKLIGVASISATTSRVSLERIKYATALPLSFNEKPRGASRRGRRKKS